MSKPKFTQGPWQAVTYNWNTRTDAGYPIWNGRIQPPKPVNKSQLDPYIISTAAFGIFGKTEEEAAANAYLIAAAPSLYEALKATSCRYSRTKECVAPGNRCDRCAALASAEGEAA